MPNTDSSAITGVSTACGDGGQAVRRRSARPAARRTRRRGRRPPSRWITAIASSGVQPWLASTRMRASGRRLAHRAHAGDVGGGVGADLELEDGEALGRCAWPPPLPARRARPAETVTSVATRCSPGVAAQELGERLARPAALPGRAGRPPWRPWRRSCRRLPRRSRGPGRRGRRRLRPRTTSASGPLRHASAPASDSPVTRQTCGASPYPLLPSLSTTSTTVVSRCSVRRSAVTNGVCSCALSR